MEKDISKVSSIIRNTFLLPKTLKAAALNTAMIIATMGVATSAQAIERLTLATQIWTPYQTVDENGEIGGVAVDRVKCALRRMGQPYEIRVMRWDKAQLMVETGEMHGFSLVQRTADVRNTRPHRSLLCRNTWRGLSRQTSMPT